MPSHIDVRCGHFYEALVANNRAIAADRVYLANEGAMNFHTLSRIHNYHLKIYASLFLGQFRSAMEASDELIATTPEALLRIENPAMICRRFAMDFPDRVTALGILHSAYARTEEARQAVQKRVEQARIDGPSATVEAALERWFSAECRKARPDVMDLVRTCA